jgi:hypothetical protein
MRRFFEEAVEDLFRAFGKKSYLCERNTVKAKEHGNEAVEKVSGRNTDILRYH